MAHLKGSLRFKMPNLMVPKRMAENPAAIRGAIAHDAATWDTLPFFQPHDTSAPAAIPAPTRAPTTVWVVDTGNPDLVAIISHAALPNSVQPMMRINVAGLAVKCLISIMLFLIVPVLGRETNQYKTIELYRPDSNQGLGEEVRPVPKRK